jgi:hypothetical protein
MTLLECVLLSIVVYLLIGIFSLFLPIIKEMFDVKNLLPTEKGEYNILAVACILLWPIILVTIVIQWCEDTYNKK